MIDGLMMMAVRGWKWKGRFFVTGGVVSARVLPEMLTTLLTVIVDETGTGRV